MCGVCGSFDEGYRLRSTEKDQLPTLRPLPKVIRIATTWRSAIVNQNEKACLKEEVMYEICIEYRYVLLPRIPCLPPYMLVQPSKVVQKAIVVHFT